MKDRDFGRDFCGPAIVGLNKKDAVRVGIALDAAIAFGVLEYLDRNESLQDRTVVEAKYWNNVTRLKRL